MKTGKDGKNMNRRMIGGLCAAMLLLGTACAEPVTMNGTVEAGSTVTVYAPVGGTVEAVPAETGAKVTEGQELLRFQTEKVYAARDGVIRGVFGAEGEDAETVAAAYGAVMYLEGEYLYSVSASVSKAYSSVETMIVHPGEKVYLQCRNTYVRNGTGVITAVDGSNYTVLVDSGEFLPGDAVDIYREELRTDRARIGRGNISRVSPEAVTAAGAIVRIAVKDGQKVRKGDVLLETLSGTFDAYAMTGTQVTAPLGAVVKTVNAGAGGTVEKGAALFELIPVDSLRAETTVDADELKNVRVGTPVIIELESDESKAYAGTVSFVSALPAESEEEDVTYRVLTEFVPDEDIALGMKVIVTTAEPEAEREAAE